MTIEKLSSGSYRASVMKKGVRYRITFDHKPTKREAEDALMEKIAEQRGLKNGKLSFRQAAEKYIEMKQNVLSPTTLAEYGNMNRRIVLWFSSMQIDSITQVSINKLVNELSVNLSPKSVRNYHAFISSILGTFRPEMHIYTTLPQKRKSEPYIPSDDDVKRILEELKGSEYYFATLLACFGLRRGEILALTCDDIDLDGTVHIRKSLAVDSAGNKVIKLPKTTDSERDIMIPKEIAQMIIAQGYVYNRKPGGISEKMREAQDKLGIPRFSLHKLRHYFASKMLTITDSKTVQELGGWKTDRVMKTIYAHSMKDEKDKAKRIASERLKEYIL